jgi:hypothetical protein
MLVKPIGPFSTEGIFLAKELVLAGVIFTGGLMIGTLVKGLVGGG